MGLFDRFGKEKSNEKQEVQKENRPKFSHLDTYQVVQHRALIGWIVTRCAAGLKLEEIEREELFTHAFTSPAYEQIENEQIRELMLLAEKLVDWIHANAVIEEEMKTINPQFISKNVLTRVFSEIQADVKFETLTPTQTENTWGVYRDVIYASTHGGFLLITKEDVTKYQQGELVCSCKVITREDIAKARNTAKEVFSSIGIPSSKVMSYNLIISEAVTNILKHAEYGEMNIYYQEGQFNVVISDKGPGFPLKILPKMTLMAGFSTKESLGQGFTLMMKMAKQVVLETSSEGSTLILVLDAERDGKVND